MPSLFLILGKDRSDNNFVKLSNLFWAYTFIYSVGTLYTANSWFVKCTFMRGSRGWGCTLPLENDKSMGFLSNTGLDPLKNHKATNPAFSVGPLSFRLWADDGPL